MIVNSFDGALTILGIITASCISGIKDPKLVFMPGLGAAIAMCVSGIWGAYVAEIAEIKKKIMALETHLLQDLSDTEFTRKKHGMAWIIGLVNGLSPLIVSLIILTPFLLVNPGILTIKTAYYNAFAIIAAALFITGVFAGNIAKENMIKQGLIMLMAGMTIGAIFILLTTLGIL